MINRKTITVAQNGSLFFLKFPDAMQTFDARIKQGGMAGIFHTAKELLEKEWSEKESSTETKKDTKSTLRELTRSLRRDAHNLEDVINSLLALDDRTTEDILLEKSANPIADYDDFLRQLAQLAVFTTAHGKLSDKVDTFIADLEKYKKLLSQEGNTVAAAQKEHSEAYAALEQEHPYLSAASAATREFLRYTNPELRAEFLRRKTSKVAAPAGKDPAEA